MEATGPSGEHVNVRRVQACTPALMWLHDETGTIVGYRNPITGHDMPIPFPAVTFDSQGNPIHP